MANIVIFYWEKGSCGDFVNSLLLSRPTEYQSVVENFVYTSLGRVKPTMSKFFIEKFDNPMKQWYFRDWSVDDCTLLSELVATLDCKSFVIPTHRLDLVDFLQSQFPNSITIGITYPKNMFPLILKNWCKKSTPTDNKMQEIYNSPLHTYLKTKNSFGEFVLAEQLKYGSNLRLFVDKNFDISISLEDLYNNNLSVIESLFQDCNHVKQHYDRWIQHQNHMHRYCYNLPWILQQALGHNSKSTCSGNLDCNLDAFDNILINHYCKTHTTLTYIPKFKTLQQATKFFKENEETDNYSR